MLADVSCENQFPTTEIGSFKNSFKEINVLGKSYNKREHHVNLRGILGNLPKKSPVGTSFSEADKSVDIPIISDLLSGTL